MAQRAHEFVEIAVGKHDRADHQVGHPLDQHLGCLGDAGNLFQVAKPVVVQNRANALAGVKIRFDEQQINRVEYKAIHAFLSAFDADPFFVAGLRQASQGQGIAF